MKENKSKSKSKKSPQKMNLLMRILALFVTIVLTLGAIALVAYRDELNMDSLRRWLNYRNLSASESGQIAPFTHAGGDGMDFACIDSGIIQSSQNGAHYYSFSGEQYAERVEVMEHPVLSASDSAAVVYDAGGQSLSLFRQHEESFSLSLEDNANILSARVNDSNWLALTTQEQGYKGIVTVYDDHDEKVIQINLSSTFVVDAAISPDNKHVAVVTMGQENGIFQSTLLIFPMNNTEPSATLPLGNIAVLDLEYEDDQIWVLGESQLLCVDSDGKDFVSYSFGTSFLQGCSMGGDGFVSLLLSNYRAGTADLLVTVGKDGTALNSLPLLGQVLSMDASGRYLSLLSSNGLETFTSDLIPYSSLTNVQDTRHIAQVSDGSVLLADKQEAWLYLPTNQRRK